MSTNRTPSERSDAKAKWRSIFHLWDSIDDLASDVGRPYSSVNSWYVRGFVPSPYWHDLVSAGRSRGFKGLTYKALAQLANLRRLPREYRPAMVYPRPSRKQTGRRAGMCKQVAAKAL